MYLSPWKIEENSKLFWKGIYYIDTDEIPGFFLLLKNHIFIARSEDTIFVFHVWGYWNVAMVTNMISQLQESFQLSLLNIIVLFSPL